MPSASQAPSGLPEPNQQSVKQQWLAILSVAVGAFALVTSEFLPVGVLNDVASDLGISAGHAGLMVTLPGIMAALAAPLLSVFIGTMDRRYLLISLTLIMIVANSVVAFASDFNLLLFGRVLLGIRFGDLRQRRRELAAQYRGAPAHPSADVGAREGDGGDRHVSSRARRPGAVQGV